ncbi:hypothetical protein PCURB6_26630 [Paenibacillus curdlanolyticus]|nr:hypothetical protein PCURB6_26630 [Paenibacillus curdlanolyticus]
MSDVKSVFSRLEDNGKSGVYINQLTEFKVRKKWDELTCRVESGWGLKASQKNAVVMMVVIDKDEFERICNEIDTDKS